MWPSCEFGEAEAHVHRAGVGADQLGAAQPAGAVGTRERGLDVPGREEMVAGA